MRFPPEPKFLPLGEMARVAGALAAFVAACASCAHAPMGPDDQDATTPYYSPFRKGSRALTAWADDALNKPAFFQVTRDTISPQITARDAENQERAVAALGGWDRMREGSDEVYESPQDFANHMLSCSSETRYAEVEECVKVIYPELRAILESGDPGPAPSGGAIGPPRVAVTSVVNKEVADKQSLELDSSDVEICAAQITARMLAELPEEEGKTPTIIVSSGRVKIDTIRPVQTEILIDRLRANLFDAGRDRRTWKHRFTFLAEEASENEADFTLEGSIRDDLRSSGRHYTNTIYVNFSLVYNRTKPKAIAVMGDFQIKKRVAYRPELPDNCWVRRARKGH